MTLSIGTTQAAALSAAGTEDNPIIGWNNLAGNATISTEVGTEETDGDAENVLTGTTWDQWMVAADGSGEAELRFVFASDVDLSFMALAAHNLGTLGATVALQYSTNSGSSWSTVGGGLSSPSDDSAIAAYFDTVTADYWRVYVSGLTSGDIITLGVAFLGTVYTMTRRFYGGYRPPLTPTEVSLIANISEGGHLLGTRAERGGSTATAQFTHIAPSVLRASTWLDFQRHFNNGGGFFMAWRPTKYGDLHYAWRAGDVIAPVNNGAGELMDLSMQMRFYDDA